MASKGDIQATRSTAAPDATAIVAAPVRLRGIIIASDAGRSRSFRINYNF
jgi:hypothetical protein